MNDADVMKALAILTREVKELRLEIASLRKADEEKFRKGQLLTLKEACDYLRIGRTTIHNRISSGEIDFAVKKGKTWVFNIDKLKRYAAAYC